MLDKGSKKSNPLVLINEISIPSADVPLMAPIAK